MRPELTASIGIVIGGAFWGLFWIPIRFLSDLGLHGAWAGMVLYVGASLVLSALFATGRFRMPNFGLDLIVCGLLTGAAFSLYATALLLSDVVRVILLFYLTPIWGTLLGVAFLGERFNIARVAALVIAFVGMLVVLGIGNTLPIPRNTGDWLALLSGMFWAVGTMRIYQMGQVGVFENMAGFLFGALVITAASMVIAPGVFAGGVSFETVSNSWYWGFLLSLYVVPMLVLTIWPTKVLTPGRMGILLMSEVIVGVVSAALYSGEHFGLREALGAALIISAAFVEVLGNPSNHAQDANT